MAVVELERAMKQDGEPIRDAIWTMVHHVHPPPTRCSAMTLEPARHLGPTTWYVTVQLERAHTRERQAYIVRRFPRDTEVLAHYRQAQALGLPLPTVRSSLAIDDVFLVLLDVLPGRSLADILAKAQAPWEISAAAVSLADLLLHLHSGEASVFATLLRPTPDHQDRSDASPYDSSSLPSSLSRLLDEVRDWIAEQCSAAATRVPTLDGPRLAAVFLDASGVSGIYDWQNLALRPAAHDFARLLLELQTVSTERRTQFLSITLARYLQEGGSPVAEAPAIALDAIIERILIRWAARASQRTDASPDFAETFRVLESAYRAAQNGLVALAAIPLTL